MDGPKRRRAKGLFRGFCSVSGGGVCFNSTGIRIEMLGDYDTEDPWTGRGLQVLTTTCLAVNSILAQLTLMQAAARYHRAAPRTTKTCPGKRITKEAFIAHLAKT